MSTVLATPAPSRSGQEALEKFKGYWQWGDQVIQMGLSDEMLAHTYQRLRKEGTLDLLFYERPVTMYEFMTLFLNPKTNTLGAFWENPETRKSELCGLGFVRDIVSLGNGYTRADVGEAFFRGLAPAASPLRFGRMMVEYAFSALQVSAVMGITPAENRAARIFPRRLGFTVVGPVPGGTVFHGVLADVMISSMTATQWQQHRPWVEEA